MSEKAAEMDEIKICWKILPRVSRSFALAISLLPKPLSDQTMLTYLLYRLIDTVEDSQAKLAVKKRFFSSILRLFSSKKYSPSKFIWLRKEMVAQIDCTYEHELIDSLPEFAAAFYSQPKKVRAAAVKWGREMAYGMLYFQKKQIRTFADQSRYSHYVAGVVGYFFNDLLYINKIISRSLRNKLQRKARHFGLALQKVNILRDVAHDVEKKRYYWPLQLIRRYKLDYESLLDPKNRMKAMEILREEIEDAMKYLKAGIEYIKALPKEELGVRLFCLIPLFMAIESYLACVNNSNVFDKSKRVKISRLQVWAILLRSQILGKQNDKIEEWFEARMNAVRAGIKAMKSYQQVQPAPTPR
jgi:farnesyl-diphosphate farnesyltransferase